MNKATHCCTGDCNQGRACTARQPAHAEPASTLPPLNPFPFAPGVIEGMPEGKAEESLTWWLLDVAEWAAGIAMVAGTAGFVAAKMGWL